MAEQPAGRKPGSEAEGERAALVVGVGASAGGLEALERLFEQMPEQTGCAFVVVQHLSPDFKSVMDELLARRTRIAIHVVEDGTPVRADAIYLSPAKKQVFFNGEHLFLADRDPSEVVSYPIDHFFRSLAREVGKRAVGIVLSGTGSDGSRGLRELRAAGGAVIAQTPESAAFDGMPQSALETGMVDRTLSPEEMPDAILELLSTGTLSAAAVTVDLPSESGFETILRLLKDGYGIDFASYKPSTILRRTQRRAELARETTLERYARRLAQDPAELDLVYKDLLIGVTRFFRDQGAFDRLSQDVLVEVVRAAEAGAEIRVWTPGCATGEEAYTLAMLLREEQERQGKYNPVKIFATDVHQDSLRVASAGSYAPAGLMDVSAERRQKFFVRREALYQVSPELRAMVVFAPHNVLKDAPFTNLDLVSCRNLLIYFEPQAQRKALGVFHFGLKPQGALLLGPSETPGDLSDEFQCIDQHWKIFRKRRDVRLATDVRVTPAPRGRARAGLASPAPSALSDPSLLGAYDALLEEFVPSAFLVGPRRELVHSFGGASRHLQLRDGRMSSDLADMLDGDLRVAVMGALQRVYAEQRPVKYRGTRLDLDGQRRALDVTARPVRNRRSGELYALVAVDEPEAAQPLAPVELAGDLHQASREQLVALETELKYTRENLQATIEELETSNEELQATNEELVAANEELQSTNEELHSVNEELHTVNSEFQRKITELMELNADMDQLQTSTDVHVLFVDSRLCIRKFSPHIAEKFNLLPQDVGRSIEVFAHTIERPNLIADIRAVAAGGPPFEGHVRDASGRWYLLRILPYRRGTTLDGVVLTLIDVTHLRDVEREAERSGALLTSIVHNSPSQIFAKDLERRFILADRTFLDMAGQDPLGRVAAELFPEPVARALCAGDDDVLGSGRVTETELTLPGSDGPHSYLSVKFPLRSSGGEITGLGAIHTDVTRLKRAENDAREAVAQRDRFLAMLSHELRNPLAAVLNASNMLGRKELSADARTWQEVVNEGTRHMARLLEDLLDVARVAQNKMGIERVAMDLREVVPRALAALTAQLAEKEIHLESSLPDAPLWVEGDAARLVQVVTNLLGNAVRYTPPRGSVRLVLAREQSCARLEVSDTGVGIAPQMLEQVFEPFVQGHSPGTKGREGGLGVGLSVVRHIVSLHGGNVAAASAGPGAGSTFVVRLPTCAAPAQEARPPAPSVPPRGLRVLLVEDDVHGREAMRALLDDDGVAVHAVGSGEAALEAYTAGQFDAVLLDIGLPGIDGYETCRRLRALPHGDEPCMIALTGFGQAEDRESASAAGFDGHVTKPIDIDDVYRALAQGRPGR